MGWMRTLFFGDIGNYLDITDVGRRVSKLRNQLYDNLVKDSDQDKLIQRLYQENETLRGALGVLCRKLTEKKVLDESELDQFLDIIDTEESA